MSGSGLSITGIGAVSSVGLSAAATCASIRAGICRFAEHPYHYSAMADPPVGEPAPLTYAPVPFFDPLTRAPDRLLDMALAPLEDAFTSAGIGREDLGEFGLFLATTPVVDGIAEWGLEGHLLPEFFRRAAMRPFGTARLERSGSTGFYHAMRAAAEALEAGECRFALIGGVDSWLSEESVKHFDKAWRLKSPRNRDGFIPGEAGVFVVAETAESVRQRNATVLGVVDMISLAEEEQSYEGELGSSGTGLTQVLREVVAAAEGEPEWVICDLNGESYRAHEWGLALVRLGASLGGVRALWHPADCVGDLRAAGPALHLVMACRALHEAYAPARSCVMFAGDDGGERAACLVRAAD